MIEAREIRRLHYLAAIGITPLVSRRALPGARVTRKLQLKSAPGAPGEEVQAQPPERAPGTGAPTPGARLAAELRQKDRAVAPPPAAGGEATPVRDSRGLASAPAERFRIALLFARDRLWLEDLDEAVLAREQVDLVAAIAAALAHPQIEETRPAIRQFDWPLHGNAQLDLGADEAASALSGFLGRQLAEREALEVICLGEAVALRVRGLGLACTLRELPSTREMLAEPLLKRRAWELLRR